MLTHRSGQFVPIIGAVHKQAQVVFVPVVGRVVLQNQFPEVVAFVHEFQFSYNAHRVSVIDDSAEDPEFFVAAESYHRRKFKSPQAPLWA